MDGWMVLKMPSLASLNELWMVSMTRKTTTKWQFSLATVLASQIRPDFIKNILTFDRYWYFPNVTRQNIEVLLSLASPSVIFVSSSQMLDGGVCFCLQHVLPASFGPLCGSVSTKLLSMALGSCLFIAVSETLLNHLPFPFLLGLTFSSLSWLCLCAMCLAAHICINEEWIRCS